MLGTSLGRGGLRLAPDALNRLVGIVFSAWYLGGNGYDSMNHMDARKTEQLALCQQYGTTFFESPAFLKVGISRNVKDGARPIHGLRHPPEGDTTGWYIWGDEFSEDPDFFVPLHVEHLQEWCPMILKYLG